MSAFSDPTPSKCGAHTHEIVSLKSTAHIPRQQSQPLIASPNHSQSLHESIRSGISDYNCTLMWGLLHACMSRLTRTKSLGYKIPYKWSESVNIGAWVGPEVVWVGWLVPGRLTEPIAHVISQPFTKRLVSYALSSFHGGGWGAFRWVVDHLTKESHEFWGWAWAFNLKHKGPQCGLGKFMFVATIFVGPRKLVFGPTSVMAYMVCEQGGPWALV